MIQPVNSWVCIKSGPVSEGQANMTDSKESTEGKKSSPEIKPLKAFPVHTEEELYRFVDLGLGRGLDGTNATPWLNKTSFQVRQVTFDSIVGTEEGGALQSYEREVSSVQTHQAKIKGSLVVPQSPLTIGTDAELSRSVCTMRRTVGKKIINRTISFCDDFSDICYSEGQPGTLLTFEQRLIRWVSDYLSRTMDLEGGGKDGSTGSEDPKLKLDQILEHGNSEHVASAVKACYEFVQFFRITHYVSAIELGAAEYKAFTDNEYQEALSVAGSLGIDKLASFVSGHESTKKKKNYASDIKSIGRISKDHTVERGSYNEAVVCVKVQPITTLIRTYFIRQALRKALVQFVEVQSDRSDGPYILSCNNDRLFLKVEPDGTVVACENIRESSQFYILPTDNKGRPYEFYIAHSDKVTSQISHPLGTDPLAIAESSLSPVPRYLEAPVNIRGTNPGPLSVRNHVMQSDSCFVIHSRLVSSSSRAVPLALTSWTSGREVFFVNCSGHKHRKDGYLCVRQSQGVNYITSCVRDVRAHNSYSTFMLFRLLPGYYSTQGFPGETADAVTRVPGEASAIGNDKHEDEDKRHAVGLLGADPTTKSVATDVPMLEIHKSDI